MAFQCLLNLEFRAAMPVNIVNRERFAGLNFCGFHPMKFFMGILLRCLMLNNAILYRKVVTIHIQDTLKATKNAKV